jgi:hypothetical protein
MNRTLPTAIAFLATWSLLVYGCSSPKAPVVPSPAFQAQGTTTASASSVPDPIPVPGTPKPSKIGRCSAATGSPPAPVSFPTWELPARTSKKNLLAVVRTLSSRELRGREAGSPQSQQVAQLLANRMATLGLVPAASSNDFCQSFPLGSEKDQNVVGKLEATAPTTGKACAPILIGAHYDALGMRSDGEMYPGADDNASGIAVLLEIARLFEQQKQRSRDLILVAFGAEEMGVVGSKAFVRSPPMALSGVGLMINLDMVGRPFLQGHPARLFLGNPARGLGYIVGSLQSGVVKSTLQTSGKQEQVELFGLPEWVLKAMQFSSDSVPFSAQVPTLFLSSSVHDDYHKVTDVPEKVDVGQMERVTNLVKRLVNTFPCSQSSADTPHDG